MRFEEVFAGWNAGKLKQEEAARFWVFVIGLSGARFIGELLAGIILGPPLLGVVTSRCQ